MERPATRCFAPWTLVQHEGKLRLAYFVQLYGGGPVMGQALGGKGHLVSDSGEFDEESRALRSFTQGQIQRDWRKRPSYEHVQKAKAAAMALA